MRTSPTPLPFFHPASLIATVFGTGLVPVASGTAGSAVALPAAALIYWAGGPLGLFLATIGVFTVGWWASTVYVNKTGTSDPGAIVIDEVAGQWLVALFRLFDIVKPWPVSWADRKVKGGLGVMLDDILAGVYGGAILIVVAWFIEERNVL
jgi:phosphatidylglycerophosphatase A